MDYGHDEYILDTASYSFNSTMQLDYIEGEGGGGQSRVRSQNLERCTLYTESI